MTRRSKKQPKRQEDRRTASPYTRRRLRVWHWVAVAGAVALLAGLAVVLRPGRDARPESQGTAVEVPNPDTAPMEPRVAQLVKKARGEVLSRPYSAEAWGHFGAVNQAHRLFEFAEPCYRRAAETDPKDFRWPYLLAIVLEIQGAPPEEVVDRLQQAAVLRPDYPPIPLQLGNALMRQGRLDEAHDAYSRAAELDPQLALAYRGLGQVLVALGRPEEALEQLERALAIGGEDDKIYSAMAQAYARLGEMELADQAAEKSRTVERTLPLPDPVQYQVNELGISARQCYTRAKSLMETGDFEQAISQLEIVNETQPEHPDVEYRLGACYSRTGRREAAVEHLTRALTLDGDHSGAHEEMGRLLAREGKMALALPHLETFVRLRPDSARGHWFLGQVLEGVGRGEEARQHYQRAVELDPNSPAAERL